MKRKSAAVIAAVMSGALLVTGLGGCGADVSGTGNGSKEKVRLMVWSPSEDQSKDSGEWLQTSCEAFAAQHPEWGHYICLWCCRRGISGKSGSAGP